MDYKIQINDNPPIDCKSFLFTYDSNMAVMEYELEHPLPYIRGPIYWLFKKLEDNPDHTGE